MQDEDQTTPVGQPPVDPADQPTPDTDAPLGGETPGEAPEDDKEKEKTPGGASVPADEETPPTPTV